MFIDFILLVTYVLPYFTSYLCIGLFTLFRTSYLIDSISYLKPLLSYQVPYMNPY